MIQNLLRFLKSVKSILSFENESKKITKNLREKKKLIKNLKPNNYISTPKQTVVKYRIYLYRHKSLIFGNGFRFSR